VLFLIQLTLRYSIENFQTGVIVYSAPTLDGTRVVDDSYVAGLVTSKSMETALTSCRSYVLRPALIVQMVNFERQNQLRDYDKWAAAAADALAFAKHAVRCAPADSNFWLRYAMISRAITEDPEVLGETMTVAAQYAPFEFAQLSFRALLWRQLSVDTEEYASLALRQDIETIIRYGNDFQLKLMYSSRSSLIRKEMQEAEALVDKQRQAHLVRVRASLLQKQPAKPVRKTS
jgi:hypothetical protein